MSMNDRTMMMTPDEWPRWPLLPLKRTVDGRLEEAIMVADGSATIYLCNMFALPSGKLGEVLAQYKSVDFASVDDLLDAGWEVD